MPDDAGERDAHELVRFAFRLREEVNGPTLLRLLESVPFLRRQKAQKEDAPVFELVALERAQVAIVEERKVLFDGGVGEPVDAVRQAVRRPFRFRNR